MSEQTYPYDDEDMVYDYKLHKYVITPDGVWNNLNEKIIELLGGDDREADIFLKEQSNIIYNRCIYRYGMLNTRRLKEYHLAKTADLREVIKEALIDQIRYAIRSGANLIQDQHGVNIEKGFALDHKYLRGDAVISPEAKDLLSQAGLLYSGYLRDITDEEYRDGY